jgi:hypothetical protein
MSYKRTFCGGMAIMAALVTIGGCAAQAQKASVKKELSQEHAALKAAQAECKSLSASPEVDPIRNKVELFKDSYDPAPFEIASNDTFPTEPERVAIAKWASGRDACLKRYSAIYVVPPSATVRQRLFIEQEMSFGKEANARVGDLIVALYQQRLTYAEFAHRRYEILHDANVAETAFAQAVLEKNAELQLQAKQQFANSLAAWASYMQAVNARQPQTVYIQGSIQVH